MYLSFYNNYEQNLRLMAEKGGCLFFMVRVKMVKIDGERVKVIDSVGG